MGKLAAPVGASNGRQETVPQNCALEQLERILSSSQFRTSKRCSLFLRYVVEHAGSDERVERLKERTIGVEVFDRAPQYDTNQDPVVRVAAGEVRKRLAQYYLETGRQSEPRISLPAGSYLPELQPAPQPEIVAVEPAMSVPEKPPRSRRWWIQNSLSWVLLAVAVTAATVQLSGVKNTGLESFWAPVLEPEGPVLVCIGQPKAYHFMGRTQGEIDRWFEARIDGREQSESPRAIPVTEIFPAWDHYLSIHDVESFARISALFARSGRQVSLRGGRAVSLTDVRGRPVVLIGAFNNEWTLNLTRELRFYFDNEASVGEIIRDRQHPEKVDWTAGHSWPQRRIPFDYAIITRVRNPVTEQIVVIAAGLTHFGTQAAGEFITSPTYFAEALRGAPVNWNRKNMQIVLSAKVISGTVGPPKVIATHFW